MARPSDSVGYMRSTAHDHPHRLAPGGRRVTAYLTIVEVADRLRLRPKRLMKWLRENPCDQHGEPFFGRVGQDRLFTEADVGRIFAAFRREVARCSNSTRRATARTVVGAFAAPTSGSG